MVATILYPPLKGKNTAMDEQVKNNMDPAVDEKEAEASPPVEAPVEKEVEAALPPAPPPSSTEVTEVTVES